MGSMPSSVAGNSWRRLSVIFDAKWPKKEPDPNRAVILAERDYHFMPNNAILTYFRTDWYEQLMDDTPQKTPEVQTDEQSSSTDSSLFDESVQEKVGTRVILSSKEGVIKVYESQAKQLMHPSGVKMTLRKTIDAHTCPVVGLGVTLDGKRAISTDQNGRFAIWDLNFCVVHQYCDTSIKKAFCCDIAGDGSICLIAGRQGGELWNPKDGQFITSLGTKQKPPKNFWNNLAIHEKVLFKQKLHELGLKPWPDTETHSDVIKCCKFQLVFPHSKLITGSWDNSSILWDVEVSKGIQRMAAHTDRVMSVANCFDPNVCVSVSWDKMVCIWDFRVSRPVHILSGHSSRILTCSLSYSNVYESVLMTGGEASELKLWDLRRLQERSLYEYHQDTVVASTFTSTGEYAVTVGLDEKVLLWRSRDLVSVKANIIAGQVEHDVLAVMNLRLDIHGDVESGKRHLSEMSAHLCSDKLAGSRFEQGIPVSIQKY
uniref:Uncharacterized protein n=1 Tax=Guillardia theta TaxID=55529 RepID=A0A7S4N3Q0_GUITH|mmetsp:Transcript_16528/g.55160  ORF Transcript_16528/g.55160 Transcript_16528/m.55160 type:complete len:485 (+) Transcript_16528:299-1753(+)